MRGGMKIFRIVTTVGCVAIFLGTAACSSGDDRDKENAELPLKLCDTEITTAPIKKLFPAPYNEAFQTYSHRDSLSSLKRGRKGGKCSVGLTYDDRFRVEKTVYINIEARVSNDDTAKELIADSHKFSPLQAAETVHAKKISGISGPKGSAVAFPCTERTDQSKRCGYS